jgi:hypothetical protein
MDKYYGHKKIGGGGGYYFFHVYPNIHQTEMCGDDSIYELTLSEDNSDDEWGWDLRHLWGFLRVGDNYDLSCSIPFGNVFSGRIGRCRGERTGEQGKVICGEIS